MLSESQERMLLVTPPNEAGPVRRVMDKWEVECRQIGEIVGPREVLVSDGGRPIAHLPIQRLAQPPQYRLQGRASPSFYQRQRLELAQVPLPEGTPGEILLDLLGSPNIASRRPVHRQYDNQVQTNTVVGPGGDAAVLRIKHSNKGIALTIDGNGRYCYLDPYRGGQIVVAEVCRNLTCAGATPLALTDCLNFGNPENPEVYFQLEWCIRGMAKACRALGVPVVSGNVSLYNESRGQAVFPTPVVGGARPAGRRKVPLPVGVSPGWTGGGRRLGLGNLRARASDLAGSEYLVRWVRDHGRAAIHRPGIGKAGPRVVPPWDRRRHYRLGSRTAPRAGWRLPWRNVPSKTALGSTARSSCPAVGMRRCSENGSPALWWRYPTTAGTVCKNWPMPRRLRF